MADEDNGCRHGYGWWIVVIIFSLMVQCDSIERLETQVDELKEQVEELEADNVKNEALR